jgi:hypothetical protein
MEWELVKPWGNRVGIVLEFLSFWFAAPEILGEGRLRKLERGLEVGVRLLSVMVWVTAALLGLLVGVMVVVATGEMVTASAAIIVVFGLTVVAWGLKWEDKVISPLLRVLADYEHIRQRSLAAGAVLFVVGFLLQLIATF